MSSAWCDVVIVAFKIVFLSTSLLSRDVFLCSVISEMSVAMFKAVISEHLAFNNRFFYLMCSPQGRDINGIERVRYYALKKAKKIGQTVDGFRINIRGCVFFVWIGDDVLIMRVIVSMVTDSGAI